MGLSGIPQIQRQNWDLYKDFLWYIEPGKQEKLYYVDITVEETRKKGEKKNKKQKNDIVFRKYQSSLMRSGL